MKAKVIYNILVFDRGRFKHTLQVERKRWVIPGWEG